MNEMLLRPTEVERPAAREAQPVEQLFEAFPRSGPPALPFRGPESESSRYVLPFLLVGMVALILLFSYLSTPRPVDLAPSSTETAQLSQDRRVLEAEKLAARGDQLWDEGYRGFNNQTLLSESAAQYREAWLLLTGQPWNSVTHAANAGIGPTLDSSRARILTEKVRTRLAALEETLR